MGGTFFVLSNICKVPLKHYLHGLGPAITTGSIGLITFSYHAVENYTSSDPDSSAVALKRNETSLSTRMIMNKLHQDQVKAHHFLEKFATRKADITRLEEWNSEDANDVSDILNQLYNSIHFDIRMNIEKYSVCMTLATMQMACHFMECMLLQAYHDPDIFNYGEKPDVANVLLSLLMVVALYNGVRTFLAVKQSYEKPSAAQLCDTIFKAFDAHQVPLLKQNKYDDAGSINTVYHTV